ncbi:MAG TPA: hypothetical protein VFZ91_16030 [Allosphingosinicella sp.]
MNTTTPPGPGIGPTTGVTPIRMNPMTTSALRTAGYCVRWRQSILPITVMWESCVSRARRPFAEMRACGFAESVD